MSRLRRHTAVAVLVLTGVLCAAPAPPGGASPATAPSHPGAGYTLDWENPADHTLPAAAPPGWHEQYDPAVRHGNGEPQVRVAAAAAEEPVRTGRHSVRFELDRMDPLVSNGVRAEIEASPPEPLNAERWYGFSTFLPSAYQADPMPEIIAQWHQYGGACAPGYGCSPPLSIITRDGRYWISQNWQIRPPSPEYHFKPLKDLGGYATGEWTDWVVHVKWSLGDDGVLQVWKNGSLVHNVRGRNDDYGDRVNTDGTLKPTTGVPPEQLPRWGNYLVLGLYKWSWRDRATPVTVRRRVLYTDELRVTDARGSYSTVAPRGVRWAGQVELTGALQVTPGTGGAATNARFTVTNRGGSTITIPHVLVGARTSGGANVDFPARSQITLPPGGSHTYQTTRALTPGTYTAWPAFYDGTTWRELFSRSTFTVRA